MDRNDYFGLRQRLLDKADRDLAHRRMLMSVAGYIFQQISESLHTEGKVTDLGAMEDGKFVSGAQKCRPDGTHEFAIRVSFARPDGKNVFDADVALELTFRDTTFTVYCPESGEERQVKHSGNLQSRDFRSTADVVDKAVAAQVEKILAVPVVW